MATSKRSAREAAMKMLYQYGATGEMKCPGEEEASLFELEGINDEGEKYIRIVAEKFPAAQEEIDKNISENSHSWRIERIAKVDLAILRLAIYELQYMETPKKVVVNEAIELAKKYSADKSYKFVNGLLGGYLKQKD